MIDLSTSDGLQQYIGLYKTLRGRSLASRLGLAGKGSEALANAVSCFVWNARALEVSITDQAKSVYSDICRMALEDILASPLYASLNSVFKFPPLNRYKRLS